MHRRRHIYEYSLKLQLMIYIISTTEGKLRPPSIKYTINENLTKQKSISGKKGDDRRIKRYVLHIYD